VLAEDRVVVAPASAVSSPFYAEDSTAPVEAAETADAETDYRIADGESATAEVALALEGVSPTDSCLTDEAAAGPYQATDAAPADSQSDLLAAEVFDEAGYLRLNPDVRRAIEVGEIESGYAHYFWHGRAEGRALPDSPREARNTMLVSAIDGGLDVFPKEARCSLEALFISPKAGLMIVGWIDDASHPLSCIRIIGPDWRVVIDGSRLLRVRRGDVENALGGRREHAFGFIGFLHFDRGGSGSGSVQV